METNRYGHSHRRRLRAVASLRRASDAGPEYVQDVRAAAAAKILHLGKMGAVSLSSSSKQAVY